MDAAILFPGAEFDHLGVACTDPDQEALCWQKLGYETEAGHWEDGLQGVAIRFLKGPGPRIELLSPLGNSKTLDPYLKGGSKIYHMAYRVNDFDTCVATAAAHGRIVASPRPACAFDGNRVAFVLLRNMLLVELIERTRHE